MSCTRQTTPAFTNRPCPPYKSKDCPGQTLRGNDGNMWVSRKLSGDGSYRWMRQAANKAANMARKAKEAKKKESFKKHLRETFVRLQGQEFVFAGVNKFRTRMIMFDNGYPKMSSPFHILDTNPPMEIQIWGNVLGHTAAEVTRDHLRSLEDPVIDDYIRRDGMPFIQRLMKIVSDYVAYRLTGRSSREYAIDSLQLHHLIKNAEDDDLPYFRRLVATHAMFLRIKELFEAGLLDQDLDKPDNRPHSAFFPPPKFPGQYDRLNPVRHGLARRKPRGSGNNR
jgi:hypothetical protein